MWYAKADALYNLGRHEDAIIAYRMVLELAPNDFEAWFDYAETLTELKRFEEAMNAYETAIALEPAWSEPHYGRAKLLYRERNLFETAVELLISFKLDPMRLKQYEMEFPVLGTEEDFVAVDGMIKPHLSGTENSAPLPPSE